MGALPWPAIVAVFLLAGFIVSYKLNKMSLLPSLFLSMFVISAIVGLLGLLHLYAFYGVSVAARIWLVTLVSIIALISIFGIYILIAVLLISARIVLKKEKRSLAHALGLFLAISLIGYLTLGSLIEILRIPHYVEEGFVYVMCLLMLLYATHILLYMLALVLCNLARPKLNQDYVIIHGSGLINGRVTPLLAGRIDKAIEFYHKQRKKSHPPKLILSGGQGIDEPRPEAVAMMEYVFEKGVPKEDVLLEEASTTTLENMKLSKLIMDKHAGLKPYNCIFVTSNYHLLRTGIYARIAGLSIDGIGAKTALYYLPNALIREYIAYVVIHKEWHLVLVSLTLTAGVLLSIFSFFAA